MIKILSIVILFLIALTSLLYIVFRFIQPVKPIDLTSENNKPAEKKKSGPWLSQEVYGWLQFIAKIALIWIIAAWFFDWPFNPKEAKKRLVNSVVITTTVSTQTPREEWRTIFSANLSEDAWSEAIELPMASRWKITKCGNIYVKSLDDKALYFENGRGIELPKKWTHPPTPLRFKGNGKMQILVKDL